MTIIQKSLNDLEAEIIYDHVMIDEEKDLLHASVSLMLSSRLYSLYSSL